MTLVLAGELLDGLRGVSSDVPETDYSIFAAGEDEVTLSRVKASRDFVLS